MRENLVDKNRILPSLILIITLSIFYFFNLNFFLIFFLYVFTSYDLYSSRFLNFKFLIFLVLVCILLIYISEIFSFLSFLYISSFALLFIFSFIYKKYLKIFFILLIFLFLMCCYELIKIDSNLFYLIIILSFINDTSAYIFGRFIKGPLILKNISPKKTWSGTSISFFISTSLLLYLNFNFLFSIFVSTLFFFGDIYFSYIKRSINIKDFSNLLGGHGGLLDRLDSIFFVILIFLINSNF